MAQYDEKVLAEFADKLYKRADEITFTMALLYGVVALIAGFLGTFVWAALTHAPDIPVGGICVGTAILGALIGAKEGYERSFKLRLDAQQILVQVQIERNTRHDSAFQSANPPTASTEIHSHVGSPSGLFGEPGV